METTSVYSNNQDAFTNAFSYNSEWNKLRLLLWKNSRLKKNIFSNIIISLLTTLPFCLLPILLRVLQTEVNILPTRMHNSFNISEKWIEFVNILNDRRTKIRKAYPNFTHNPFVPNNIIGYAPNVNAYNKIMQRSKPDLKPMIVKQYQNCTELRKAIIHQSFYCGICFSDISSSSEEDTNDNNDIHTKYPKKFTYTLMYPSYLRLYNNTFISNNWQTNTLHQLTSINQARTLQAKREFTIGYIREGFAHVQHAIALSYIRELMIEQKLNFEIPKLLVQRYPEPEKLYDVILERGDLGMSLMIILCHVYPILSTVAMIVEEKKENGEMLSQVADINNYLYCIAWIIKAFMQSLYTSVIVVILLKIQWCSGLAIFNKTSFISLLIIIWLYNIISISFCLMITAFCNRTRTAIYITILLSFLSYLPFWATAIYTETRMQGLSFASIYLFHNTVLGYIIEIIQAYETQNLIKNSIFEFFGLSNIVGNYTIAQYMGILIIQGVVYLFISVLAKSLTPSSFGLSNRWNFMYHRKASSINEKYRESKNVDYDIATNRTKSYIEEVTSSNPILVQINGVTKKYGEEIVVKNINLQLRENEITILTGHNSSGKTTILAMVCGFTKPTSGNIKIEGFSVLKDQKYACASLGVALECSILYEDLTVEDQLRFFSYLKGLSPEAVEQDVQKYLLFTNLLSKRHVKTRHLTKGTRQELEICCALSGHSRIVLLDEPNAFVDPKQRKRIWELLTQEKKGRTILIATNYSDCFNFLADRVAILCHGELKCVGSPTFLHKIYASGYNLTCTRLHECDTDAVTQLLRNYIPNINPISQLGMQVVYLIDEQYADSLENIGKELQANLHQLRITMYKITQCTLNDINLRMGSYMSPFDNRSQLADALNGLSFYSEENEYIKFMEIKERVTGKRRFLQHCRAYFTYYWLITGHNKVHILQLFLIPPIFTWLAFVTSTYVFKHSPLTPMFYSLDQYGRTITTVYIKQDINSQIKEIAETYSEGVFWLGTKHTLEDTRDVYFEEYILQRRQNLRMDSYSNVGISFLEDRVICWYNYYSLHTIPLTINLYHNALQNIILGEMARINVLLEPIDTGVIYSDAQLLNAHSAGVLTAAFITFAFCLIANGIVFTTIKEKQTGFRNIQESSGLRLWIYWFIFWLNDSITLIIASTLTISTIAIMEIVRPEDVSLAPYYSLLITMYLGGYCIYSLNYMIAEIFENKIRAFICTLLIGCFGLLTFCHYEQIYHYNYISKPSHLVDSVLLLIPHIVMSTGIMTIYYTFAINNVCSNPDINFMSKNIENSSLTPNCGDKYTFLDIRFSDIPLLLIIQVLYTILFWVITSLIRTKKLWNFRRIPRDNLKSQYIDHQRRHDNDGNRYNEKSTVSEAKDILHMSGIEMKDTPLVCDRVGKLYGDYVGVDRVNLIVKRKQIVGLVGETGSGKSILCKLITTNENLSYGRIYTMGISTTREPISALQNMSYSPESNYRIPGVTMQNLLTTLCRLHDYPPKDINDICINLTKILGIYPHYYKSLRTLSHGTHRALLCATALLGNRALLVIDSISVAIDEMTLNMIWRILEKMRSENTAIVFTCNNFRDIKKHCNRICFLSRGYCTYVGPPYNFDKLYSNYYFIKIKLYHKIQEAKNNVNNKYVYVSTVNKLQKFMSNEFPTSEFQGELGNCLIFLMPMDGNEMWYIFSTLKRNTNFLNIEHFDTHDRFYAIFLDFIDQETQMYR